jgi:hypothetical protein
MTATRTRATAPVGRQALGSSVDDQSRFIARWLKVWVALIAIVIVVVVFYLIFITNSLASINGNLAVANRAVTGAGGHTKTLPDQVQSVNSSLGGIDPALKPIPGQADAIIGALTSIDGKLHTVDASLKDTSASLINTESSLTGTSGVLQTVLGQVGGIRDTLVDADQAQGPCESNSCNPAKHGVQNIHQRVAIINNVLDPAEKDAGNILKGLINVNGHLASICSNPAILGAKAC